MAKRSRLLIDPQVQWSLALRLLGHWALLVACLLMVNTMISLMMMAGQKPLVKAFAEALQGQTPLLAVLFVMVPVFIRDTLKLSNRFAGPMYRLRTGLAAVNDPANPIEEVRPIKLREGDFWSAAADDYNKVLDRMKQLTAENERLRADRDQPICADAVS